MRKIFFVISLLFLICSCIGTRKYYGSTPNYESISNPPIYLYLKKENMYLDNIIDSLLSIDNMMDIHIWFEEYQGSCALRLFTTEHECRTMDFIDVPNLIGYSMYKGHFCYLYMNDVENQKCSLFQSLFVQTQSFLPYDSIYSSNFKLDSKAHKRILYYEDTHK